MTDKVSLRDALNEASRDAQAFRDARRNADEVVTLRAEIARLRAEVEQLRAGLAAKTLRAETVRVLRKTLLNCGDWNAGAESLADLNRCYPPEEV